MAGQRYGHGFVMGKLYPFHAGHQALIRAAQAVSDRVTVLVQGHESVESIPLDVRVDWVRREHPQVRVVGVDNPVDVVDFESAEVWDRHMAVIEEHLPEDLGPVDAVFTSDAYGEELARRLRAEWVQVDPGRSSTPISGTAIRADPAANWWALPTPVREWFCRRVEVTGRQLADDLAAHFGTLVATGSPADVDRAAGRAPRPLVLVVSPAPGPPRVGGTAMSGTPAEQLRQAVAAVDAVMAEGWHLADPLG